MEVKVINELIKKLRKAADVLDDLLESVPENNKEIANIIGKRVTPKTLYMTKGQTPNRKQFLKIWTDQSTPKSKYGHPIKSKKKHWTQLPKNRAKVLAKIKLMQKANKAKAKERKTNV
jgi:hypothetical protein